MNDADDHSSPAETGRLVRQVAEGELARFRELYERIAPSLCAWARLRSNPALDLALEPDDLLQEVWLRAFENLSEFDPQRGSFRAWIFGIAKNVALDAWRRKKVPLAAPADPSRGSIGLESWPDVATSIHTRLARDESSRLLMQHVAGFDPVDRSILVACGMEGVPCAVVATRLGLSADATKKRWQRLRARLAEQSFSELLEL